MKLVLKRFVLATLLLVGAHAAPATQLATATEKPGWQAEWNAFLPAPERRRGIVMVT